MATDLRRFVHGADCAGSLGRLPQYADIQEAASDKSSETTAIPALLDRLGSNDGLKGAVVSIDAIATNATIAKAIRAHGADYLLAVKANQPTLRAEVVRSFDDAPGEHLDSLTDLDKSHGRIEERTVTVSREIDWLSGQRRFPGELRLPEARTIIGLQSRTELKDRCRFETRYFISSAPLSAARAAHAVRSSVNSAVHLDSEPCLAEQLQHRLRRAPVT